MERIYYIYITMTKNNKMFNIGITRYLEGSTLQHKKKINKNFTIKYNVTKPVYYDEYSNVFDTIKREKN